LAGPEFLPGSYIIRVSEKNKGEFNFNSPGLLLSLSLKKQETHAPRINRFLISRENKQYIIEKGNFKFDMLTDLVEHYSGRCNKSNIVLTFSVKREASAIRWDFPETSIKKEELLGEGQFGKVHKGVLKHYLEPEPVALKSPKNMTREEFLK
ncbi:hypothetical protein PMAYCL1PPCAC_21701, partial [Pristionchus mayeri]